MSLIIPPKYKLKLLPETTEMAIKMLKDAFQERLSKTLNLRRVTAPKQNTNLRFMLAFILVIHP